MDAQKYKLLSDHLHLLSGCTVYLCTKHDYAAARDFSLATGVPHVSITLDETGDYPCYAVPSHLVSARVVAAPQKLSSN